jgi:hypothetical protein
MIDVFTVLAALQVDAESGTTWSLVDRRLRTDATCRCPLEQAARLFELAGDPITGAAWGWEPPWCFRFVYAADGGSACRPYIRDTLLSACLVQP